MNLFSVIIPYFPLPGAHLLHNPRDGKESFPTVSEVFQPMSKTKLTNLELDKWVREGFGISEIARKVGVSKGTVSKRLKALNVAINQGVVLHHAGEIVEKKLDTVEQLQKINDYAKELLDLLMRWNRRDEEALQILESQVRKVRIGKGKDAEEVTEYRFKDPRELALKAMGEIRGQLALQLEIFKMLYDAAAVAEFQKEVLEAISDASPKPENESFITYKKAGLYDQLLSSISASVGQEPTWVDPGVLASVKSDPKYGPRLEAFPSDRERGRAIRELSLTDLFFLAK